MKKMICAMIMVLGMVMMVGCNGANDKEEATDNDELYRVNIEDPISGCRVERGNKIYSLSGLVSTEKAEEYGIICSDIIRMTYEDQFRDDTHIDFKCISLYDESPSSTGDIIILGDQDPFAIKKGEKIICYFDGLRFYSAEGDGYVTLEDGSAVRSYTINRANEIDVVSENKEAYWLYDTSSLESGLYYIDFSYSSHCPLSYASIITIE